MLLPRRLRSPRAVAGAVASLIAGLLTIALSVAAPACRDTPSPAGMVPARSAAAPACRGTPSPERISPARSQGQVALPEEALVRRVIDGDTVELGDGRLMRYIGIDTPEMRRKSGGQWIEDPEPFGQAAKDANATLVEGKTVQLEYDVETHDRYSRLLAYVYVGETMVNASLLSGGYAQQMTIPPNVKHVEEFRRLVQEARDAKRGLWSAPRPRRTRARDRP